jgi:hypothetical protein
MERFGEWFKKRGFWYQLQRRDAAYSRRDTLFYYNSIWPALKSICAKWCISDPFPPEWTFDKRGFYSYAPGRLVALPTGYTSEHAALLWTTGPVEIVSGSRNEPFSAQFTTKQPAPKKRHEQLPTPEMQYLQLRVDVTRPQKELLPEIQQAIRLHRDKLSRSRFVLASTRHTRRRLDQYSAYLRVWDLRQNGLSFRQIALEVYPNLYPHHPAPRNPIIQRVMDHYRRAETLVHGGYKELV